MSEPSPAMRKREAIERPLSKRLYKAIWRTPRNWDEIEKLFAELKVLEEFRPTKALEDDGSLSILAELPQSIWNNDDFQDGLEMIRAGRKAEQFSAYTTILEAIKTEVDRLTEKHSASAVGGEKTE